MKTIRILKIRDRFVSNPHGQLNAAAQKMSKRTGRKVDLVILPTDRAVDHLARSRDDTNAILHVTC